jgi:hypothetical protein
MSNHSKIDTHDNIDVPGVSKSDVTGTTIGNKRALDVSILSGGGTGYVNPFSPPPTADRFEKTTLGNTDTYVYKLGVSTLKTIVITWNNRETCDVLSAVVS